MRDSLPIMGTLEWARAICPKSMLNGPCGGVREDHSCEANRELPCPYLSVLDLLPWRGATATNTSATKLQPKTASALEAALCRGEFVVIAEAYTPDTADLTLLIEAYAAFKHKIHAVNIAEHALATPHTSTLAAATLFKRAGIDAIINLTCRDRNRIGLQGEVLGAAALDIDNVFCVTGDHPVLGDHPNAKAVFDLDSIELIKTVKGLCDGSMLSGRRLERSPALLIGAAANPFSHPVHLQAERVAAKVRAGARLIQTQAIFDIDGFGAFVAQLESYGVFDEAFLIAGVAVVTSLEGARWLQREVPGARVPADMIAKLEKLAPLERRRAGINHAREMIERLEALKHVHGVLLFPLHGDVSSLAELLER